MNAERIFFIPFQLTTSRGGRQLAFYKLFSGELFQLTTSRGGRQ